MKRGSKRGSKKDKKFLIYLNWRSGVKNMKKRVKLIQDIRYFYIVFILILIFLYDIVFYIILCIVLY